MKSLLLLLIRTYQYLLSPWVGGSCRYWPTCSEYAREAIEMHGAARGSWLALCRLGRCHPYGRGGFDPVPCACADESLPTEPRADVAPPASDPSARHA